VLYRSLYGETKSAPPVHLHRHHRHLLAARRSATFFLRCITPQLRHLVACLQARLVTPHSPPTAEKMYENGCTNFRWRRRMYEFLVVVVVVVVVGWGGG
jgi:hypothetical protein